MNNDRRPFHGRPQYGNNAGGHTNGPRNNRIDNRPIIAPIGQSASVSTSTSPRSTVVPASAKSPSSSNASINHTDALNEFKGKTHWEDMGEPSSNLNDDNVAEQKTNQGRAGPCGSRPQSHAESREDRPAAG